MEGIRTALMANWDGVIEHENHGDPQKEHRYRIGTQRAMLLKKIADPFAVKELESGEQLCAFLAELDKDDLDPGMPLATRFEYICGKRTHENRYQVFAYIWFESLRDARDYVVLHGMKIVGGWNS